MRSVWFLSALTFGVIVCTTAYAKDSPKPAPTACNASHATSLHRNTQSSTSLTKPQETIDTSRARECFDSLADSALLAMKAKAATLKVGGVAVVAYFDGDRVEYWSSRMLVVDRMRDDPSSTQKGANLLGIAYAKAAEMADTLKNSGSQVRPPMTGEFGWEGGVITRTKNGYLIAAFSGGQSADDVNISHAGTDQILNALNSVQ
jgi:hypothetical protein